MLWSIRLRRGAVLGMQYQPIQSSLRFGAMSLGPRIGQPWLSLDLALALSARGAMTWPAHALLCKRAGALYVAIASDQSSPVLLHRFCRGRRVTWQIERESPGRLSQLFVFGEYAALVEHCVHDSGETSDASRLLLCRLSDREHDTQCVSLGALCQGPGILNAYLDGEHCVLDMVLRESGQGSQAGQLFRCSVERQSGACEKRLLSSCHVIDAAVQLDPSGRAKRFAYFCGTDSRTALSGVCRLDLVGHSSEWRNIPFAQSARGLAILDTRTDTDCQEDSRGLATIVHDHANERWGILLGPLKGLATQSHAFIRVPRGLRLGDALAWSTRPPHGEGATRRA